MAWSSYAHLPTNQDEYWYILSKLSDGMTIQEVDHIIADCKGKEKVQHHYRNNLAKIGLIKIEKGRVFLNYNEKQLHKNKKSLKDILRKSLFNHYSEEISKIADIILMIHSYDLGKIVEILTPKTPIEVRGSLVRWIRPIITLLKIIDILSITPNVEKNYAKFLQESYWKIADDYNQPIPFELVDIELKKIDDTLSIVTIVNGVLEYNQNRFKIELLMMPRWATKNKSYKIGQDLYTHIKIKSDLLGSD